jgi:hydrogenase nickel incorporation protein HypA/HybF
MHELAIAKELSDIVSGVAVKERLVKVTKICVCFGKMIQIVPEIFIFALEETIRGTISEGAEIDVEVLPVLLLCKTCGNEFSLADNTFVCTECDSSEIEIKQGKEIYVKSIEGE